MDKKVNKSDTRIYHIWNDMIGRCIHKTYPSFKRYGAIGIEVCDEWKVFENFYEWAMTNGYAEGLTLDRLDNKGNYEPGNCKWSTMKEQQNNRRNNRLITFEGKTKTISQWAEELGLKTQTLFSRFKRNWDIESALTTEVKGVKK